MPAKITQPSSNDTAGMISSGSSDEDVPVYTYVRMDKQSGRWVWHQEVFDMILLERRSRLHLRMLVHGFPSDGIRLMVKPMVGVEVEFLGDRPVHSKLYHRHWLKVAQLQLRWCSLVSLLHD